MKKTLLLAFALAAFAYAPMASAEDAKAPIAVVNIQQIMKDSTAAQSIRDQLEGKQKAFQADLSKKEEALHKEDQELGKQKSVLAKDAFEAKATAFRKKVTDAQKEAQEKKTVLDNAANTALGEIQKAVGEIVANLAKEKGFIVAMPTEAPTWQLLYIDSKLDITSEVLKRLNEKLPKVSVKFDAK